MPLVLSRDALFSRFLCRLAVPQVTEEERGKDAVHGTGSCGLVG